MSIASLRPIDCGGCKGLGAHSRRCPTQPGWNWCRLMDLAEALGDGIGSNDIELANMAYLIAGRMHRRAAEARDAAERPWPGYCQACKAALDPPNATWCASCGADDTDDLG